MDVRYDHIITRTQNIQQNTNKIEQWYILCVTIITEQIVQWYVSFIYMKP